MMPNQPKLLLFPGRLTVRRFNADHFEEWPWLHWNDDSGKVFCQPCRNVKLLGFTTFSKCAEESFSTTGFQDWKHATACYKKHDSSAAHRENVMRWTHHLKGVSVDRKNTDDIC